MNKLFVIFCTFFLFLTSLLTLSAEDIWERDSEEILETLRKYEQKISKDYAYESDLFGLQGSFSTEGNPNIMVSIDFLRREGAFTPEDFQELSLLGQTIYHSVDTVADFWEGFRTYSTASYGDCGDYRITVDARVSFEAGAMESIYVEQMNQYTRDHLASIMAESSLCSGKQESIFQDLVIEIVKIQGDVEISKGGANNFVEAKIGDTLRAGDYIATGFESSADIKVKNIAVITVSEGTVFSVSQIGYDNNLARTAINLQMGKVATSVRPEKGVKASFQIITPTVTVGVRGTEFLTEVDGTSGSTNVYVYEGVVSVLNSHTQEEISLSADEKAYIPTSGETEVTKMTLDSVRSESNNIFAIIVGFVSLVILFVLAIVLFIKKRIFLGFLTLLLDLAVFVFLVISVIKYFAS